MHELITHDWLDHDYIDRPRGRLRKLREQGAAMAARAGRAVCGITADEVRQLARDYGTTRPAAIRLNYGMQRVHGGGNAVRLIALLPCLTGAWRQRAGGLLLSARAGSAGARDAALQRPDLLAGRRPRTINMSTIGDDLLRASSPAFGPKDRGGGGLQQQPGGGGARVAKVVAGFARDDLFTVVLEHFLTDTADHADYVLPATTQLEHWDVHTTYGHTYVLLNEPAMRRWARPCPTRDLPRLAARMGLTTLCLPTATRPWPRQAVKPVVDFDQLRTAGLGEAAAARAPFADGGFPRPAARPRRPPGLGVPDHVPTYECASRARAGRALPAGDDLAAGAALPQQHLRQRHQPAQHRGRAAGRDPPRRRRRARHRRRATGAGLQRPRRYRCKAAVGSRARPGVVNGLGVWWRKLGLNGTNVNELTTSADRHRPCAHLLRLPGRGGAGDDAAGCGSVRLGAADGGRLGSAGHRGSALARCAWAAAAARWATTPRPSAATSTCCNARGRWPTGWPTRPPAGAAERLQLASACATFAGHRPGKLPDNASYRRYADLAAPPRCGTWWPRPSCRSR
jgi:hypothetical protein